MAFEDPRYTEYRHLRLNAPVSRASGDTPWRVARYEDVKEVLRDHATYSSNVSTRTRADDGAPSMLFSDPPEHNRLRKLVSRAFSPTHIEQQREMVTRRCEQLMGEMVTESSPDLVQRLASPLPITVIADMLGVADGNMREFKRWSDLIFGNIGEVLLGEPGPEVTRAAEEMDAYFLGRVAKLRREPESNLLSGLVHVKTDEGRLTDAELLSFCRLLLIAGNETTTGLICGAVRIFHEEPWTFQRLKEDPDLIPGFIEETLRFYAPFQMTIRRTTRPTTLAGCAIGVGEVVLPIIASANRDDAVFDDPDTFVIDRAPNPHLAFGHGLHNCLGAPLARLEGEIAVAAMVERLDRIALAEYDLAQLGRFGGPERLPVTIAPATGRGG